MKVYQKKLTRRSSTGKASIKQETKCQKLIRYLKGDIKLDDEELTSEEIDRRYKVSMNGWKKVKKLVNKIKILKKDTNTGNAASKAVKEPWYAYNRLVILPASKLKFYWNIFISFILLYQLIICPFRFAYDIHPLSLMIIDGMMDFFFLLDIIFNFFYAYINKKQKLIKSFTIIAIKYIKGFFLFDIVGLIPYYFISNNIYFLKLFRLSRFFEALAGFDILSIDLFLKLTSNISFTNSMTQLLNFVLVLIFLGQYLSCTWYYLGNMVDVNEGKGDNGEDAIVDGWIQSILVIRVEDTHPSLATKYITSLYWVYTTLTTLGYGDYYANTIYEYLFTMVVQFMGVFLFAYMMGNINHLIEALDDDINEFIEDKSSELDQWLMEINNSNPHNKLKIDLIKKIQESFTMYWKDDHTVVEKDNFINQLPVKTRKKLLKILFYTFTNKEFPIFFKGLEQPFQHELLIKLFPRKFSANETIIDVNQTAKCLYFIKKGRVIIGNKDGVTKYVELQKGSYFGDYLIFFKLKSSNAFIAAEDVHCMCILKSELIDICEMFPHSSRILQHRAYLKRKFVKEQKLKVEMAQGTLKKSKDAQSSEVLRELNFDKILEQNENNICDEKDDPVELEKKNQSLLAIIIDLNNRLYNINKKISQIDSKAIKKMKDFKSKVEFLLHFEQQLSGDLN